ncbi:MAG: iron ABC transporter permease [bacterium]|nr:iron ABC transporter permease [bacterium]
MTSSTIAITRPAHAPSMTLLAWGGLALAGGLLLPWFRTGRDLASFVAGTTGIELLGSEPAVAAALVCALLSAILGMLKLPLYRRGQLALVTAAAGCTLVVLALVGHGQPMGPAPVVVFLGFLSLVGVGLSLSGYLRADAFIAASIVWVAVFVVLFILYPLWAVLQASVVVKGRLTLEVFGTVFQSPNFLMINNPYTPRDEIRIAVTFGAVVAAVSGLVAAVLARKLRPVVVWAAGSGIAGLLISALYLGFGAVRNSVLLALVVGVASTGLGFLFALLAERSQLPTRRLLGPISILPIITPPFVLGLAMVYLFGRQGFVTHSVLGMSTTVFSGLLGLSIAQILAYTPIAFLLLQGVVRAMDVALEEASETLGASNWYTLRTVIWPLARPGIANAFLLTVIESLADFGNPVVIGGGKPYLATEVFYAIIGRYNPNEAAVFGVVLLSMTLTIFLIQRYWVGERFYVTVTGRPTHATPRKLPRALDYAVTGVFLVWVLLIVLLYGSIFVGSVTKLWGFDYTFTLAHVKGLSPSGWYVFRTTASLSLIAALPSTALGFLIGYLVTRYSFPGRRALEFSSMLSFAVPGTVMGIGYILAFNQGTLLLTGTELIIIMAFVFRNMPVAIRSGVAAIHQIDRSLEECSTMLRAGSLTTLRRVVAPLVQAALLSGLVFAFVRAMTAVSQVIFLVTPRVNLSTALILSYVEHGSMGRAAALSSVLVVFMAVVIMIMYSVTTRIDARAGRGAQAKP